MVGKLSCIEPTPGLVPSMIISINMQKAGEPENDVGFPKHNYIQLNCSCYSYPSKPI